MSNLGDRRSGRRWICAALFLSTLLFFTLLVGHSVQHAASQGTGLAGVNAPAATCPDPIKIMLLGDSITRGFGYEFKDGKPKFIGYRQWLYWHLKNEGYNIDFVGHCQDPGPVQNDPKYGCGGAGVLTEDIPAFDTDHEGHGGKKTNWFLKKRYSEEEGPSRLEYYLKQQKPDIILLHIGMNDLTEGRSANEIRNDIVSMLNIIYEQDPKPVVILAKVIECHWRNDKFLDEGIKLNAEIGNLANEYDCDSGKCVLRIVDMACPVNWDSHYADCIEPYCRNAEFDGRHPNKAGYEEMFKVWRNELDQYLPIYCGEIGGEWVDMGNVSDTGQADEPALALSPNGAPFIAWSDYSSGDWEIYVKEWQNTAWVEKGDGSAAGGGISDTSGDSMRVAVTVGPGGSPIVAWEERKEFGSEIGSEIYVKHWQSGAWQEIGAGSASGKGISNSGGSFPGAATRPALAYGPDGPIVAWHNYWDYSESYQIYVKRWQNGAWREMGAGSASNGGISNSLFGAFTPSVAVHGEEVFIAWSDSLAMNSAGLFTNNIYLKRWDGNAWTEMGGSFSGQGISKTEGDSYRPSLAIGPDGQPVVAWEDNTSGNYEIYLKKWNGNAWAEMNGSASGCGISGTATDSNWPALAIAPNSLPVVAWQENRTNDVEVYGKRWNGDSWAEMNGSASGGGISNYGVFASKPSLAVDASNTPIVAWDAGIAGDYDVFVRRWKHVPPPLPTPTPAPTPSAVPSMAVDHSSGAPGSFFTLSGRNFPEGEEATVTVNGRELGSLPVSSQGEFAFLLSTSAADPGYYLVTASVNPMATVKFELAIDEPLWPQEGTGPVLEVPAGIAFTDRLFLPLSSN